MIDTEDRNQAQSELQRLVDAVPQHIVVLHGDGRRLYANQAVQDYHGLSLDEFLVEPITNCFHPEDLENYSRLRDSGIARGEPWESEVRLRRKDGQYRWFLIRAKPVHNEQGLIIRWYLARTDIEDRKVAELELRRLIDVVPQYMRVDDKDGKVLYANDRLLDYFGFSLEEAQASDFRTRVCHPDDLERVSSVRADAMSRGVGWEVEARIRRKDGQYRWFLNRYNPLRDEQGNIVRWYAAGTDIEDRKQAERELRQIVDAVPQHITVLAADGRRLYGNKVALDFHGCTLEEFLPERLIDHKLHPEDLASYWDTRKRGISNGVPFKTEARILAKNGQYRWFLFLFNPLLDEQGQVLRWYATATDIEDRKQAEAALQRSEDRLRLLLDFTNNLITKLDLRGLLRALSFSVRKVVQCDLVAVYLPASEPHSLRSFVVDFPVGVGFIQEESNSGTTQQLVPVDQTLAGLVFRTGKAWVGTDRDLLALGLSNDPGIPEGLKTGCVLPILCCDSVLGVLALARRNEKTFDQLEVELLGQVAGQVAIAIVNALAVEERKRAEEALRRTEAYLAEAQRLSHTGSFAHDAVRGEISYWSPETFRLFGFDPAKGAISYQDARSRIHPDDLQRFDEARERGIREKTGAKIDFRIVLPDGSVKHIHCLSHPSFNASGEVIELVGTNMDVTEQHEARTALEKAFEEIKELKDELYRENLVLKDEIDQASMFEEIVGTSEVLRRVLVQVAKVAPTDSTVLISGETGTGKELIARAIHRRSQRSSKTFVSVNCAAIPAGLIGSELFGHEKGAFTGATQRRLGRFELADGGTLFLDEVGDLPPETQIALLRVLQERQLERVGGTQSIAVNVRIIAATNRDLKAAVTAGTFRSDLFYRLNVFPITVPPLRDRKDDIPLLVEYLTERYASKAGKKIKNIHKRTLELFQAYDWPGNIRELQNVIERAVILCDGETFSVDESWLQAESPRASHAGNGLARLGDDRERELIESALAQSRGRIAGPSGAAAKLGIPRSTLETKIRRLGIRKHQFNSA
jgi:PAS domain S-box-containing protein